MTDSSPKVRVGVGVFILQSKRETLDNPAFLIGKRINSHGSGTYALPGGHLEFGETLEECATREIMEETGLRVTAPRYLTATNDYMAAENKHYITMFMVCERMDNNDEAQVLEPNKCEGWEWIEWEELLRSVKAMNEAVDGEVSGRRLFLPLVNLIDQRPGAVPANERSRRG